MSLEILGGCCFNESEGQIDGCFSGCSSLYQINIPEMVIEIPFGCFFACISLKEVVLPFSILQVSPGAFSCCSCLQFILMREGIFSLSITSLINCNNLSNVLIPHSVQEIPHIWFDVFVINMNQKEKKYTNNIKTVFSSVLNPELSSFF
jgi:hypothetical protein